MGLVSLFRGPRFLVFSYSRLRALPFFAQEFKFSIPVIGKSFGKDRGPPLLEVVFSMLFSLPSI